MSLHREAFCLMAYVSDNGETGEMIWNSRDGVTPFVVTSRDGVEMTHVDWDLDVYAPDFRPVPGMRMFVDMDEGLALQSATKFIERMWDHPEWPMSARYESKEKSITSFAKQYVGGVTVIDVPPRVALPPMPTPSGTTAGGGRFA